MPRAADIIEDGTADNIEDEGLCRVLVVQLWGIRGAEGLTAALRSDQGGVWIFRFRLFGDPIGELSLTRGERERNGWRVEIPAEVEERLQQRSGPPRAIRCGTGGDGGG